jgi:tRNA (adenine37-N6)-methyltransferase
MKDDFHLFPVAVLRKNPETTTLHVFEAFTAGLLGLEGFSHVILLCWFHESDTREKRTTLRVHPRNDKSNPLTGVFATRSPKRPNPVALYTSRIHSIHGNVIGIDPIDAMDGTPVVDIKPYIPESDSTPDARVPDWVKKRQR